MAKCTKCGGTGADAKKTKAAKLTDVSYVRCWHCVGNGLEPQYPYENWRPNCQQNLSSAND